MKLILHGVKRVHIRSYSGPHFPGFSRSRTEYGKSAKNADQNNSEYGLFLSSDLGSLNSSKIKPCK